MVMAKAGRGLSLFLFIALFGGCGALRGCQGCSGCGGEQRVAELIKVSKSVERDFASSVEKWRPASAGDDFRLGDGLRTGPGALARLRLFPDGRLLVQGDTVLRFQSTPPGEKARHLEVTAGSVEIESANTDLRLHTVVGVALIESGSRVRLRSGGASPELEVLVGSAQVERGGELVGVAEGERLQLEIGGVVLDGEQGSEQEPAGPGQQPVDAAVGAEGEQPAEEAEAETGSPYAGPATADLDIVAGESAILHDPSPPTDVRISLQLCPYGGAVEVRRASGAGKYSAVRGEKSAVLRLLAGAYQYRVRCSQSAKTPGGRVTARGRLSVLRDAGLKQLPKRPPSVTVDADGRSYTVRYQNRLPRITIGWPDAPAAAKYKLNLASPGGKPETRGFPEPRVVFESGELGEGAHRFSFSAPDGRKSPETGLKIAFDNMARTASVSEPAEGKAVAGQKVVVAGEALARSKVSVGAQPLKTDSQGRFRSEIEAPAEQTAIAVRVQHRAREVHYYLRNLAGGS
jgi:hypothetical protein